MAVTARNCYRLYYSGNHGRDKLHKQKLIHPCPLIEVVSFTSALDKAVEKGKKATKTGIVFVVPV